MKKLYDRKIEYLESVSKVIYDLNSFSKNGITFKNKKKTIFLSNSILETTPKTYDYYDGKLHISGGRINFKKFKRIINNLIETNE